MKKDLYLKKDIIVIYYAFKNLKTPLIPKIIIILTVGYALSPIDLTPDFIPILDYSDDLLILPALIALSIKLIPKEIMDESREKAIHEPLKLKRNWFAASIFILIWIILLSVIVLSILKNFLISLPFCSPPVNIS
ncbi:MAG: DUF1232 domain-containing protein [Spirochaetaceae bacterium]|nr:DUF1232 domain-containing protein [Spirochaetaceae bacterium]